MSKNAGRLDDGNLYEDGENVGLYTADNSGYTDINKLARKPQYQIYQFWREAY